MNSSEKEREIRKTLKVGKTLLLIGIPLCLLTPLIFTLPLGWANFSETGSIGDTIGGITAPFINILGAILVFLALKAQIEANLVIQAQIDRQDTEKKLENESRQLNQYYSNLKSSIDNFKFSTIELWDIENEDKVKPVFEGSEAIYKMFSEYICEYHGDEDDIASNPKITELISMLEICEKLLNRINDSHIIDRETLWTLTSHQFTYRIFPRLSEDYPDRIDNYFCESCDMEHGFPERISFLIKSIYDRIKNGLQHRV
ncbi:hypothetical protein [Winogradskyella rapida]|uniref:Phage abortive infection protein n=1 Tax=Winogradskyella rapida TaxID=549701 RepID=A0ABW3KT06_9FLAO